MSRLLTFAMLLSAALFVALSATMNAIFLSSLGRTSLEANALATISVAADIAKAALPLVLVRAILLRAWGHVAGASVMLLIVVVLSLASGTGFAALTRGTATAARQAQVDDLAARQKALRVIEVSLEGLAHARAVSLVEADIATEMVDWRWISSASCSKINGSSVRHFCTGIHKLKADLAAARERDRLLSEHAALTDRLASLRTNAGGTDSDPQATVVAQLLGVDTSTPRLLLTTYMAVVIELGSVILILLVNGPALRGWREPSAQAGTPPPAVTMPASKDVSHWHRQRDAANLFGARSGNHGR